jgi:mRNA interferase MazF
VVARGDIAWLEHPDAGRRPVLVLTRDAAIPVLRHLTVALITRTVRGIPTEVALGADDGMPEPCAVTLDSLSTIPKALLSTPITRLPADRMQEICLALARATGCAA